MGLIIWNCLITHLQQHQEFQFQYPNNTLRGEYDLTEEIYILHQTHNLSSSFEHIKGHQDKCTSLDNLPLRAQMNVQADKLAEDFYSSKHLDEFQSAQEAAALLATQASQPTVLETDTSSQE